MYRVHTTFFIVKSIHFYLRHSTCDSVTIHQAPPDLKFLKIALSQRKVINPLMISFYSAFLFPWIKDTQSPLLNILHQRISDFFLGTILRQIRPSCVDIAHLLWTSWDHIHSYHSQNINLYVEYASATLKQTPTHRCLPLRPYAPDKPPHPCPRLSSPWIVLCAISF